MPAPITIVIPTLNAARSLPGCAAALMEGVREGVIRELIVSDGGSTDDTSEIAREVGARVVTGAPSRGGQLQRGCAAAQGSWLLILHADTQLAPGWTVAARTHMETGHAGWGSLQFDRGGHLFALGANLRSRLFGLPYGDQGLLLPRALYDQVGGYKDQPLMEDVALARALKGHLSSAGFVAVTSAEKYRTQGWLRRSVFNLSILARYYLGTDLQKLAKAYRK